MIGLLIVTLEVFLLFFFFSIFIIGRSPDEVLQRKNPWDYYLRMFRAIKKICPRQTYSRIGFITITVLLIYVLFTTILRDKDHYLILLDVPNFALLVFSITCFAISRRSRNVKERWVHLRILAHQKAYKKRPRITKYGSLEEVYGVRLRNSKKEKVREFIGEPE